MNTILFVLGLFLVILAVSVCIGTYSYYKQVGWTKREENIFYVGFFLAVFSSFCVAFGIFLIYTA